MKNTQETPSGKTIFFIVIIVILVIAYCTGSNKNEYTNNSPAENETVNLNNFSGRQFIFKSTLYDKEVDGTTVSTRHEVTYHTFDFINMTVT